MDNKEFRASIESAMSAIVSQRGACHERLKELSEHPRRHLMTGVQQEIEETAARMRELRTTWDHLANLIETDWS